MCLSVVEFSHYHHSNHRKGNEHRVTVDTHMNPFNLKVLIRLEQQLREII